MKILTLFMLLSTISCVSGYQQYYQPNAQFHNDPGILYLKSGEAASITRSIDLDADLLSFYTKNYVPIGISSFNGVIEDEDSLKRQAIRVGATHVIYSVQYNRRETANVTVPITAPSSSNHSGIISHGGRIGSYSGTTQNFTTQQVPIAIDIDHYTQTAIFLARHAKLCAIGIITRKLSNEEKLSLTRNNGVVIGAVVENTPAFQANILPGDVIIAVDDIEIGDSNHLGSVLDRKLALNPKTMDFKILRNGHPKTITLTPNIDD